MACLLNVIFITYWYAKYCNCKREFIAVFIVCLICMETVTQRPDPAWPNRTGHYWSTQSNPNIIYYISSESLIRTHHTCGRMYLLVFTMEVFACEWVCESPAFTSMFVFGMCNVYRISFVFSFRWKRKPLCPLHLRSRSPLTAARARDAIGRIGKTKTKARNGRKKEEIGWQF